MGEQNLRIDFGVRPGLFDSDDFLIIQQRDWNPYTGKITKSVLANAIANMLYSEDIEEPTTSTGTITNTGTLTSGSAVTSVGQLSLGGSIASMTGNYSTDVSCELDADGNLVATIYVYPSRPDLRFQLHTTHGNLGTGQSFTYDYQEIVQFRLSDSERLTYPVLDFKRAEWLSDVYDNQGGILPHPDVEITNRDITTSQSVYGSLLVTYGVKRFVYQLTIPENTEEIENEFDTVVYGVYDGGVNWLEVRADSSSTLNSSMCRGGGGIRTDVEGPEDPEDPESTSDRYTTIDYCTQTIRTDYYS